MEHDLLTWTERGRLWLRLGIRALVAAAAIVFIVCALPPLLSLLLPFVLGLVVAWLLNPSVRWLHRRTSVSRKAISLILIVLLFCVIGGVLFGVVWAAVSEVRSLFENWESVTSALLNMLENVNGWLGGLERFLPGFSADSLLHSLADWIRDLDVSGWLASMAGRAPSLLSAVSGFSIAAVVFLMAGYFITGDYPRLRFLVTDRIPADARTFCATVRKIFVGAFGGYIKSQLILTLGVFVILLLGFTVVRQPYGLMLAAGLAVLDFIPILGSGTVMVPWMVSDVLMGNYVHAIRFGVIWGLVVLFRRIGEPKILGDQTGLSPILSLVGIYVGMRLAGVGGMVLGPVLILVCVNLVRLGIFHPVAADLRAAFRDIRAILRERDGDG